MSLVVEPISGGLEDVFHISPFKLRESYQQCSAYTKSSMMYRGQAYKDNDIANKCESFVVKLDDMLVFLFLGVNSAQKEKNIVNGYVGRSCVLFFNSDLISKKSLQAMLRGIDKIINKDNVEFVYRDFLIGGNLSPLSKYLLSIGASIKQCFTQVIDLEQSEKTIRKNIRKRYSSFINWGLRELTLTINNKSSNFSWSEMQAFQKLHFKVSGRNTHTEESWRRQYEMCLTGEAFVVMAEFDGELVSAGFFTNSHDSCYYGASASRRDLFEKPIFHALLWTAIMHAKLIGCKWFEVGEQVYTNINQASEKESGISKFKAGFGGTTKAFLDITLKQKRLKCPIQK